MISWEASNIIGGKDIKSDIITNITDQNYEITVPMASKQDVQDAIALARSSHHLLETFSLEERRMMLRRLATMLTFDEETIKLLCQIDGIDQDIYEEKLHETKNLLIAISHAPVPHVGGPRHIAGALVPPNDPREWAFFIASAILAGVPMLLKPSTRNPIVGNIMVRKAIELGYPAKALHLIHFDSGSNLGNYLMSNVDLRIMMGSPDTARKLDLPEEQTIIFGADNSRMIVDSTANTDHVVDGIKNAMAWPHSCMAPKIIYVDKKIAPMIIDRLRNSFNGLHKQQDEQNKTAYINMLEMAYIYDEYSFIAPESWKKFSQDPLQPVIVQADIEHDHELMLSALPFPFAALIIFEKLDDAIDHLNKSARLLPTQRSMVTTVYGKGFSIDDKHEVYLMKENNTWKILTHDIRINKPAGKTDGIRHQGVNFIEFLQTA